MVFAWVILTSINPQALDLSSNYKKVLWFYHEYFCNILISKPCTLMKTFKLVPEFAVPSAFLLGKGKLQAMLSQICIAFTRQGWAGRGLQGGQLNPRVRIHTGAVLGELQPQGGKLTRGQGWGGKSRDQMLWTDHNLPSPATAHREGRGRRVMSKGMKLSLGRRVVSVLSVSHYPTLFLNSNKLVFIKSHLFCQ